MLPPSKSHSHSLGSPAASSVDFGFHGMSRCLYKLSIYVLATSIGYQFHATKSLDQYTKLEPMPLQGPQSVLIPISATCLLSPSSHQTPVGWPWPTLHIQLCLQEHASLSSLTLHGPLSACSFRQVSSPTYTNTGTHTHTCTHTHHSVLVNYANRQEQRTGIKSTELAPPSCAVPSLCESSRSPSWSWKPLIITSTPAKDFSNNGAFTSLESLKILDVAASLAAQSFTLYRPP